MRERQRRCPCRTRFGRAPRTGSLVRPVGPPALASMPRDRRSATAKTARSQITPSTCAHTATIARNKVMDVSAHASSTTARTMMLPLTSWNVKGTLVHVMFQSQWTNWIGS